MTVREIARAPGRRRAASCASNTRPTTLATFIVRRGPSAAASIRLRTSVWRLSGSADGLDLGRIAGVDALGRR